MIKRTVIAFTLLALMTVAVVQAMEKEEPVKDNLPGLSIGLKAPDFELKTLEGHTVKLSDYKGKKVMLNFWATWCPPCKAEMPDMQTFYSEEGEDIEILAINIDPEYDVAGFVEKMKITFPILLDEDDQVMNTYQILTIPSTFFIDEKGIISQKYLGAMPLEKMKEYADKL